MGVRGELFLKLTGVFLFSGFLRVVVGALLRLASWAPLLIFGLVRLRASKYVSGVSARLTRRSLLTSIPHNLLIERFIQQASSTSEPVGLFPHHQPR